MLVSALTAGLVKLSLILGFSFAAVFSVVDPLWATPINTLLLVVLAILARYLNRNVQQVSEKTDRNHEATIHAASAAASAAEAASVSARIAKEIGAAVRSSEPVTTGSTDATGTDAIGGGHA